LVWVRAEVEAATSPWLAIKVQPNYEEVNKG
jgi:hypothetical protein